MASTATYAVLGVSALAAIALLLALWLNARRSRTKLPEFDGGFRQNNPPPVRTIIWSKHINSEEK